MNSEYEVTDLPLSEDIFALVDTIPYYDFMKGVVGTPEERIMERLDALLKKTNNTADFTISADREEWLKDILNKRQLFYHAQYQFEAAITKEQTDKRIQIVVVGTGLNGGGIVPEDFKNSKYIETSMFSIAPTKEALEKKEQER